MGKTAGKDLAAMQPYELLLVLSSVLVVLLSAVLFGIQWAQGISPSQLQSSVVTFVANLVLGGALWVASRMVRSNLVNGAIVAGVVSVTLIWYGGQAGLLGGVLGLLGAVVAGASRYRSWLKQP
jgi:hypothetical protein